MLIEFHDLLRHLKNTQMRKDIPEKPADMWLLPNSSRYEHTLIPASFHRLVGLCLGRSQTHPFVDGENGTDGGQAVDVTGAVQRVETHHILPLRE